MVSLCFQISNRGLNRRNLLVIQLWCNITRNLRLLCARIYTNMYKYVEIHHVQICRVCFKAEAAAACRTCGKREKCLIINIFEYIRKKWMQQFIFWNVHKCNTYKYFNIYVLYKFSYLQGWQNTKFRLIL